MQLPQDTRTAGDDTDAGASPRVATVTATTTHLWAPLGDAVLLVNRDLVDTVYIGGPDVTTTTGLPLAPLGSVVVPGDRNWHGVTTGGTASVWGIAGGGSYTPSPAEQAAQIAAQSITLAPDSTVMVGQGDTRAVTISALPIGALGDGSDGAVTLVATTTLTRDMQYASLDVNGHILNTASYVIRAQGTVTGTGTVQNLASGTTPAPDGSMTGGAFGGVGASSTGGSAAAQQGVAGQPGADSVANITGGSGGGGGPANGIGLAAPGGSGGQGGKGAPGLITSYTPGQSIGGGAGGGAGGLVTTNTAGTATGAGGGAGGGAIFIVCATFSFAGTLKTTGGNGGAGTSGGGGAGGGGGGGGGGPVLIVYTVAFTSTPTLSTAAGTSGGAGQPGGAGTGKIGNPFVKFV